MAKKYCYLFSEGDASMREVLGGKGVGKLFVLLHLSAVDVVGPFANAELGIQPPMGEHSESQLLEVGNSFKRCRYRHNISPPYNII